MPTRWTKEEDQFLIDNYQNINTTEIAKRLNRSKPAVSNRIKRLSFDGKRKPGERGDRSKYSFDKNFFQIPNIINSYYAGYIAADGCLYTSKDNKRYLKFLITKKDIELLENFQKDIKSTHPIIYISPKVNLIRGKDIQTKEACSLSIASAINYHNDLFTNWNITSKKSLTLQPPNITNPKQIAAFICGYFDGNGSAYHCNFTKNNKPARRFNITFNSGSKDLMIWIREQLKQFLPKLDWNDEIRFSKNTYRIGYWYKKARVIHSFLKEYVDIPRLKRKWDIQYD